VGRGGEKKMKRVLRVALLGGCLILLASPGALGQEKFTFNLGWVPYGRDVGWFTALEKGFFAEEKLDVSLVRGWGGVDAAKKVGAGAADVGSIDTGAQLLSRAQGIGLKTVGMWHDKAPMVIWTLEGSGIERPKDLEGKKIGAPQADSIWVNFPAWAEINKFDVGKVTHINIEPAVRESLLLAGQYHASTGFITQYPILSRMAAKQGKKIRFLLYADHGFDIYGLGLVVADRTVQGRPEVLKRFLRAAYRGVAHAMANPDEGTRALTKHVPTAEFESNREVWDITVDLWLSETARKEGLGHMEEAKWVRTRDLLIKANKLQVVIPTGDLYTNAFLPKIVPPERGPRKTPRLL
jgi:NitT/TauT family transport system substrate-binding protein